MLEEAMPSVPGTVTEWLTMSVRPQERQRSARRAVVTDEDAEPEQPAEHSPSTRRALAEHSLQQEPSCVDSASLAVPSSSQNIEPSAATSLAKTVLGSEKQQRAETESTMPSTLPANLQVPKLQSSKGKLADGLSQAPPAVGSEAELQQSLSEGDLNATRYGRNRNPFEVLPEGQPKQAADRWSLAASLTDVEGTKVMMGEAHGLPAKPKSGRSSWTMEDVDMEDVGRRRNVTIESVTNKGRRGKITNARSTIEGEGRFMSRRSSNLAPGIPIANSSALIRTASSSFLHIRNHVSNYHVTPTPLTGETIAEIAAKDPPAPVEPERAPTVHESKADVDEVILEERKAPCSCVLRALGWAFEVVFYAFAYVPFCMSVVLHALVTRRPIEPCQWKLPDMNSYWYLSLLIMVTGIASAVAVPLSVGGDSNWAHHVGGALLGVSLFFHLLTINYVRLRPSLRHIEPVSAVRWHKPLNLLLATKVLVEFFQLCSVAAEVEWLPPSVGNSSEGNSSSAFSTGQQHFEMLSQSLLFTFDKLGLPELWDIQFYFTLTLLALFVFFVGENIRGNYSPNSFFGLVLYEGLAGGCFLSMVTSFSGLANTASDSKMVFVLMGVLLYTTPAVFVSIYRSDEVTRSIDINYAPLQVALERVAKEIWAVVVTLAPTITIRLSAVMCLTFLLLLTLADRLQYSSVAVVRARRALLSFTLWTAGCALLVVHGFGDAGRGLALGGVGVMLLACIGALLAAVLRPVSFPRLLSQDSSAEAHQAGEHVHNAASPNVVSSPPRNEAPAQGPKAWRSKSPGARNNEAHHLEDELEEAQVRNKMIKIKIPKLHSTEL